MLAAINKEILMLGKQLPGAERPIETIYFGGGTPSLLEVADIREILNNIRDHFSVQTDAEITLEANPDDISSEKLEGWKSSGINRLSIGVQSFFEEDLLWMNRAHSAVQAANCLRQATELFENITIDLIYGIPGLTDERWKENVERVLQLAIPHISCYALTVEPKTPLDKLIRQHKKEATDPGVQSEQFLLLMDWLSQSGFEHYEISNFAKPGYRSRHNTSYWQGKNYIGIGPSAHSFDGRERKWNIANNQQYIDAIERGIIPSEGEILTETQKLNELIMISLRTAEGLQMDRVPERLRGLLLERSMPFVKRQWLLHSGDSLCLAREGKLFADGIAADLFFDEGAI